MSSASSAPENGNETHLGDETAKELSTDEVALIFGFFTPKDIMRLRRVCTTWRDAAKETIVPLSEPEFDVDRILNIDLFDVDSVREYNAMRVMSTALPKLQQVSIRNLGWGHKYNNGEDPDEGLAQRTANYTAHNIDIISNFSKLCRLKIYGAPLNGRYPVLFNFPLLQKLSIWECRYLELDLEVLDGLPSLKELLEGLPSLKVVDCYNNPELTGNINSLRALKDTLEKVQISDCHDVGGNFMALADFPRLKELNLRFTAVTGDIRDIREHHFPALERLFLPASVTGGIEYKFQNASDVHDFMHAIHLLLQRTPTIFDRHLLLPKAFYWMLSEDSPSWYDWDFQSPPPPFGLRFIQAGSRRGWSWCTWNGHHSCKINWLDLEPDSESSDYEAYIEELQRLERRIDFYRGYHQPPTEEEYRRLCESS